MARKSKTWIKKIRRYKNAWDKPFKEDENKRIVPPEFSIWKRDVEYIKEAARRKNITNSCQFEKMLRWAFLGCVVPKNSFLTPVDRSKKPASLPYKKEMKQKRPKYLIHPSYSEMVQAEAKNNHKTYSLVVAEICALYKKKFPIYLAAATH